MFDQRDAPLRLTSAPQIGPDLLQLRFPDPHAVASADPARTAQHLTLVETALAEQIRFTLRLADRVAALEVLEAARAQRWWRRLWRWLTIHVGVFRG